MRWGLRGSIVAAFAAGALLVSALLAVGTYATSRHYLVKQRERAALRQAFTNASALRSSLSTRGISVGAALESLAQPATTSTYVRMRGAWFSTAMTDLGTRPVDGVAEVVARGSVGLAWTDATDVPAVVVGVPIAASSAEYYEVNQVGELDSTLRTLATILLAAAAVATVAGAFLGWYAARRVLRPLDQVGEAARRIEAGDLDTRLPVGPDPELRRIATSFNAMVDTVTAKMDHDARFAADVSHELRTPLTTLTTSLGVLQNAPELSSSSAIAVDLMTAELARFGGALEDLIALDRLDLGIDESVRERATVQSLVDAVLRRRRLGPVPVLGSGASVVEVDRAQVERALDNLVRNADAHGGGLAGIRLRQAADPVIEIHVVDAGPGIAEQDRERVFERFARLGARKDSGGTGLGLSIVRRTAENHGGSARCDAVPGGGADFVLTLPLVQEATA
jgi:signal transduction histidine kinase